MTTLADHLTRAGRRHLEDLADEHRRERDLADLDRLMREPGGLPAVPEPAPLHRTGHDTAAEGTTSS